MRIIRILILLLFSYNAIAISIDSKFSANADTLYLLKIDKTKYKLSKLEFLDKYGDNDTIIEMINLYFRKRNIAFINPEFLVTLPVLGVAISYDTHLCNKPQQDCLPINTILSIPLVCTSALFCVFRAPINLTKYSRLNLYMEIEKFRKTGIIKPKTLKKVLRRLN